MRVLAAADLPDVISLGDDLVIGADNAVVLPRLEPGAFDLVYIDPPFNTGRDRRHTPLRTVRDDDGDRVGFQGHRYRSERRDPGAGPRRYPDAFARDDVGAYPAFLAPRLEQARRLLAPHGTLYFHIDYREAHYCKVLLDEIFGRDCFLNELIWAYDYGGKPRNRWPAKHDTILVYVRDRARYHFDADAVEREPYMAPGLVTPEKAARGKLPTDVIWHTIVPTSGRERTGYPTQKPEGLVRRFVSASSRPGGWCLDFFAGSGTLGAVCAALGRRYVLVDDNPQAIEVMARRLATPARTTAGAGRA